MLTYADVCYIWQVIATLDSDEEAAAPPLEADDEKALKAWVEEGKKKISTAEVRDTSTARQPPIYKQRRY